MFFNHKLIRYFINNLFKYNGWNNTYILTNWIPNIDLSKSWTDEEIYKYFKLSDEEIQYIESKVK